MLNRQKELLQWLISGFSTSALIVGGVWVSDNRDLVIAQVLNYGPTKLQVLENRAPASTDPEHKASGNMIVTLTSLEGRRADGTLVLDANVSATIDLADLKYEWVLPDGVSITSGSATGTLGDLSEGSATTSEVTLNVPASNVQVIFHAYRELAGEKMGQVAHYNTVEQTAVDSKLALTRESVSRVPASSTARRFE